MGESGRQLGKVERGLGGGQRQELVEGKSGGEQWRGNEKGKGAAAGDEQSKVKKKGKDKDRHQRAGQWT